MAKRKTSGKKSSAKRKGAGTDKARRTAKAPTRRRARGRKKAPPRVWRSVAKLAGDALIALESENVKQAFEYLNAL